MVDIRCTVTFAIDSGIPEDRPVNTWAFTAVDKSTPVSDEITDDLIAFYNAVSGAFSGIYAQNGHVIKFYDLADPQPRAPYYERTFNLTSNPTQSPLPSELAICVSFQGNRVSGQDQKRRRGRVYLGPLATGQNDNGRPLGTTLTAINAAADDLLTASNGSANYAWCVYSRTDDAMVVVTNGWVDDAFDVQRRRGLAPTTRRTFAT